MPKAAEARDDEGKKELILALSEATSKRLVDGLADKFDSAEGRLSNEIRELRTVLLGSPLDKESGVLPLLKQRVNRLEKAVLWLGVLVISAVSANPKLIDMASKLISSR
jgi:hypothetical protein